MAAPTPLWLDCDTGHDDAFALLLAAQHPNLNLLGVSTVFGNAPLTNTTYNTRAILTAINREDVHVYPGAARPFCRAPAAAADIHGESGLDGTTCLPTPTVPERTETTAVEAMYAALIAQPKGTAWLVATGCLTNAALLFATHPDLASHIAGLSIMGGAIGGNFSDAPMGSVAGEGERFGNWTPWAEFNIYIDPESAAAVFSNMELAAKTTLIPLDLTHQFLGTKSIQEALLYGFDSNASQGEPTTVRRLFVEILTFFAKTYADVFGLVDGPPTHDPLAVAAIFPPGLFSSDIFDDRDGERYGVTIVTDGHHGSSDHIRSGPSQCGRTIAELLPSGTAGVRIPRGLNADGMWRILEECLGRVDGKTA
ncbi:related to uridine ribohydrolase [Ramularia collo-cygni]|uniref:Related to uridine ribohydrolase n=1 Tax=Ramularia collo-cygni TaxID=112498 RepID=A0A2D3V1I7_9PEZI|nr:related to uridine ribohydrolase [Ramularia collo-cygni]CZT20595.1 related to uridine ribohydrolase [Ramularia collo-cygni]